MLFGDAKKVLQDLVTEIKNHVIIVKSENGSERSSAIIAEV